MERFADRVQETTASKGTGPIALAGASAGFMRVSSAMKVGDTCGYDIFDPVANAWETGVGTYPSADVLNRVATDSSNGGALLNLAGNPSTIVSISLTAATMRRISPPTMGVPQILTASAAVDVAKPLFLVLNNTAASITATLPAGGYDGQQAAVYAFPAPASIQHSIAGSFFGTVQSIVVSSPAVGASMTLHWSATLATWLIPNFSGGLPIGVLDVKKDSLADDILTINRKGIDYAQSVANMMSANEITLFDLPNGSGISDDDKWGVGDASDSSTVGYTMAQLAAYIASKLPAGSTSGTGGTGSSGGTGSTGNTGGSGGTGGTTTPPATTTYPAAALTNTTFGDAKFGKGLTGGVVSGTVTATAHLVLSAIVNFGTDNVYPYRTVFAFTVGGKDYGFTIGDSLDTKYSNTDGVNVNTHTYIDPWDNKPRLVQIVLDQATASTNRPGSSHVAFIIDGHVCQADDIPAFAIGATVAWFIDKTALGNNGYVDNVELLNSSANLSTAVPTAAATRGPNHIVIYALNGDGAGS